MANEFQFFVFIYTLNFPFWLFFFQDTIFLLQELA